MAFHVYILRCSDGSYYTGHTDRLETRLFAHNQGEVPGYTQKRRPVCLVFAEEMPARQDAIARKQLIKGWSRAKKEALISGDWTTLVKLAQSSSRMKKPINADPSIQT
ncbi:MAG: GIY-YIG nuclease family protein [Chloroflexi bacterium]|nr:GIY-YIG nuclease family protein [Chloroflexota bacterium]